MCLLCVADYLEGRRTMLLNVCYILLNVNAYSGDGIRALWRFSSQLYCLKGIF